MIFGAHFNNIGIEAIAMALSISKMEDISISKSLLICPMITHRALLNHLARVTTKIVSFEKYLIENASFFSNFNNRYYDCLPSSINAIQFLSELGIVEVSNGKIKPLQVIEFQGSMGKRAEKISKASPNIAKILSERSDNLHLNLRIEL